MTTTTKPRKEVLRAYLYERQRSAEPPPTGDDIRRQLGWWMLQPPKR